MVLDENMRVNARFFLTVLAFVHRGASIYFPIGFSRYNPALIDDLLEIQQQPQDIREWYARPSTFNKDTGMWVEPDYGVVAGYVQDVLPLGSSGRKADSTARGTTDDVNHYAAARASKLSVMRLIDTNLIHKWYPKSCPRSMSSGDKDRYPRCMASKASREGTNIMLAMQIEKVKVAASSVGKSIASSPK